MSAKRLSEQRILVVGASAGIGRAVACALAEEGARVAAAARREDRLASLADEAPGGAVTIRCDVRDPGDCEACVASALDQLGGLDAIVYAAGVAQLLPVAEADAESWRAILETNLVGAALVTRAALPHLAEARGRAVYLSSISAEDQPPRRGLGLYATSKAALNKLVAVWQIENPAVSFTRVNVGDTGATDFAADWDMSVGADYVREWGERGLMFGRGMLPESVARHVADLLAAEEAVPVSTIVPRYAVDGDDPTWK